MKKYLFLFAIFCLCGGLLKAQKDVILKSSSDTAVISIVDSTFFIKIDGKEYVKIPKDKTVYLTGSDGAWNDFRVPVNSTTASGSNPPEFSLLKNSGGSYIGNAVSFDGIDDFDSIPANKLLNFQQSSFTVSFWMQYKSAIQNDAKILYKKNGWNIAFIHDKLRVYLDGQPVYYSTVDLGDGARNLVIVSLTNNTNSCTLNIYINGKAAGIRTFFFPFTDITAPVYIGKADSKGFGKNFYGTLDELNFWNKVLSKEERDSLWNKSKGINTTIAKQNHILGYSFDDKNEKYITSNSVNNIPAYSSGTLASPEYTTGLISETTISHGVFAYFFEKDLNEELFFSAQLPHTWMAGTDIEPHVHYIRPTNDTGTVVWGLEYSWANRWDEFPETKTIYTIDKSTDTAFTHITSSFGLIDAKGKTISSMIMCRIFRDAENPLDTYNDDVGLLEIDFHIRNNTLGSTHMWSD
jgi:hypothetical protein